MNNFSIFNPLSQNELQKHLQCKFLHCHNQGVLNMDSLIRLYSVYHCIVVYTNLDSMFEQVNQTVD